ncbi:hypothetical protein GCM10010172_27610 [Paractinoplanes ferrugineus]|uniref:Uncharacterized protein n=1 Tax=Paractinoplanes ferrugineus TaxID=113564 RepID=A0A919MBE9_9ACTN|nr:hypothetical protein [Actinoplanes ferrugineus]GIE08329.1 hypothetical protein Afe05nite_01690 [Actinoplanes ferrugineus]
MRKFWYAGAVVAGGILLFGAGAPAHADLRAGTGPAEPAGNQLADLLAAADGAAGQDQQRYRTLGKSPLGELRPADLKSAGPTGLLPDGGTPSAMRPVASVRQADAFNGGVPLLGGLGGLPPANALPTPKAGEVSDGSGLPPGGLVLLPAATSRPGLGQAVPGIAKAATSRPSANQLTAGEPATSRATTSRATAAQPATAPPAAAPQPATDEPADTPPTAATDGMPTSAADPGRHEEPVGNEVRRTFSADGRPVAGVDQQYR